jgi:hypothetical protein
VTDGIPMLHKLDKEYGGLSNMVRNMENIIWYGSMGTNRRDETMC